MILRVGQCFSSHKIHSPIATLEGKKDQSKFFLSELFSAIFYLSKEFVLILSKISMIAMITTDTEVSP